MVVLLQKSSICSAQSLHNRHLKRIQFLFFLALHLVSPVVSARPLSMLLMPIERAQTSQLEAFTKYDNSYDRLQFDNTDADFDNLDIGYNHWLCGQLQSLAEAEDTDILIRFISWDQAHNEIDSLAEEFDVVQVPSTWTAYLADKGILAKWDGDLSKQHYPEQLLETCKINGKGSFYAVPWQLDLRVMFYRKELADNPQQIDTFDKFRNRLSVRKQQMQLSQKGRWEAPFCIAVDRDWDILHNTLRYFWNSNIINQHWRFWWKPVFDNDDGMESISTLCELAKGGLVYFGSFAGPSGKPGWYGQAQGLLDGRYDAVFGGLYMRAVFERRQDVQILAAPLPQLLPGEDVTFLGGCHLAVSAAASRPYARIAKKAIERLASKQVGITMFKHTDAIPANKIALEDFFQSHSRWQDLDLEKLLKSARPYPSIPQWFELETDIVRDNFHNILLNIARDEALQTVESHIQNATVRVRHILLVYFLKMAILPAITIFAVLLAIIIWLFWDVFRLKSSIRKALRRAEELSSVIQRAKEDILGQIGDSKDALGQELSTMFQSANNVLGQIHQLVNNIAEQTFSPENHQLKYEQLSADFKDLNSKMDSIQNHFPGNTTLANIDMKLCQLHVLVTTIVDTIPKQNPPEIIFGHCILKAYIEYDLQTIRLTLKLFYEKRLLGTWVTNNEHYARIFEIAVMRWGESPLHRTGPNHSDYLPVYKDVPTGNLRLPYNQIRDNVERNMIRRFRSEVYRWAKGLSTMIDITGQPIRASNFMFLANESGQRPSYIFVLPMHLGVRTPLQSKNAFHCNLLEAWRLQNRIDDNPGISYKISRTFNILRVCPRCEPAWDALATYHVLHRSHFVGLLNNDLQDLLDYGKKILNDEAGRYEWSAKQLQSSQLAKRALDAFVARVNGEAKAPNDFDARASGLRAIVNNLP